MEWSESLSVGVETIDGQHKELIKRVNQFYAALKAGNGTGETLKVLDFLASYVVSHFKDEEALQARYNYPKYAEHRQIHKDFIETVKQLKADIAEHGVTQASSTMVAMTMTNWLVNHISLEDRQIGQHINKMAKAV